MSQSEDGDLKIVDGLDLPEEYRNIYRPGELVTDGRGRSKRLPRFFYEVPDKDAAWGRQVTAHFTLGEFLRVDLKEMDLLLDYPRHVPCAVLVLATYLERFRDLCEGPVHVSVNGGYRSAQHQGNRTMNPHSWACAADIYRIGSTVLSDRDSIEHYRARALDLGPEVTVYPYGHDPGQTDDHLHIDLGYLLLVPAEADDDDRLGIEHSGLPDRRMAPRRTIDQN